MLISVVAAGTRPLSLRAFTPITRLRLRLDLIGRHVLSTGQKASHTDPVYSSASLPSHAAWEDSGEFTTFCRSVASKDIHDIRSSYDTVSSRFVGSTDGSAQAFVKADSLIEALKVLASTQQRAWVSILMDRILSDLETHFGLAIDARFHDAVIQYFFHHNNIRGAWKWLLNMHFKAGSCTPKPEQWNTLLARCGMCDNVTLARPILQSMRNPLYNITLSTYRAFFESLRRNACIPPLQLVRELIRDMKKDSIPYDHSLKELISAIYADSDLPDLALEARSLYELVLSAPTDTLPVPLQAMAQADANQHLAVVARTQGDKAAVQFYKNLSTGGFRASMQTLMTLLRDASEPSVVKFWAAALHLKADAAAWARVISNAVDRGLLPVALTSYQRALDSGIRPTNAMLHPILRALCSSSLKPPTDVMIDRALSLFRAFMRYHEEETHDAPQSTKFTIPDAPTYNTLMRALASSKKHNKVSPHLRSGHAIPSLPHLNA